MNAAKQITEPATASGKVFTFFVLMVGLGIVAVPTGLVASALSTAREMENEEKAKCLEGKSSLDS